MTKLKFGRYTVTTSREDKIFFPDGIDGITKGDVINYYKNIAPIMLYHIKDRPLMMHRFPDGINGESFYQKNAPDYIPKWIKTEKVPLKEGGYNNYIICQNAATLVYLANQAVITPHIWLSRITKLHYPDKLVFDLDPSINNFDLLRQAAILIKNLLEELGLMPFLMTTGSHGLHVVVPIDKSTDFETTKDFADRCANILIKSNSKLLTMQIRKEKRGNKIFVDTLRNQYGATSVAPYAIRAKPKAPIATPLYWHELHDKDLNSQKYNITNIFNRLDKLKKDPWQNFFKHAKSIKKAKQKLKDILNRTEGH